MKRNDAGRTAPLLLMSLISVWSTFAATPSRAEPPAFVTLELLLDDPLAQDQARQWFDALRDVPRVNVRIRSGNPGERPRIEPLGDGASRSYKVVGMLGGRNELIVPGGKFSVRDIAKLTAWIDKVRDGGEESVLAPRLVFGLTEAQLVGTHDKLSKLVEFSTKGLTAAEVSRRIAEGAGIELESDPAARATAGEPVPDELQGLSTGTALAAALRPAGLVLTLESAPRGGVRYRVRPSREPKEFWPIGWPTKRNLQQLNPDLFKTLQVEIADTPADQALAAVRERIGVRLLFDHNSILQARIDLAEKRVNLPARRTHYHQILQQILFQSDLKTELREDEAGTLFLWVTTIRPPR